MVDEVNGSVDSLDALLERQNFRLAHWRAAARDLGYRRFFDINGLVGLRVEHDARLSGHAPAGAGVARGRHARWRCASITPTACAIRRRTSIGCARPARRRGSPSRRSSQPGEALRDSWPVDGTTGYDFLNRVSGLFVDPEGEKALTELYAEFTGESTDWAEVARAKKHQVMREMMGSDLNRLTALLLEVCERRRRYRDYTRHELHEALRDTLACFPVYRTYVRRRARRRRRGRRAPDRRGDRDRARASPRSRRRAVRVPPRPAAATLVGDRETELTMRFQQLASPVMAKGVEDTAFYSFNRLVALNEVGGDPSRFGVGVEEFHQACADTQGALAANDARHLHARHQAQRGRAGAPRPPVGDPGALEPGRPALGGAERAASPR